MAVCAFCKRDVDSIIVGEKLSLGKLLVHQYCLYFSSGLAQNEDENDHVNTINGFRLQDILKELCRESHMKCCGCHQPGGFVGCMVKSCRKAGHFPCLHALGYTFHYGGKFEAYCPVHCPIQPSLEDSNDECCICLCALDPQSHPKDLYCPCCQTVFHKACIQKQALSAGLHCMRCPVCKDKETYCSEMLRMGINIPDRDAEWEIGAAYETEVTKYCHADRCLCPEGRAHYIHIGKYRMRKCSTCGQCRGHVECLRGDETTECEDCSKTSHQRPFQTLHTQAMATGQQDNGGGASYSYKDVPPPNDMQAKKKHQLKIKVPVLVLHKVTTVTKPHNINNNCNKR